MAEKYLSNDPNAGLQDQPDYLSTDPNAGLEQKPEGGVVSGILSGLGHALNPVNLIKGALDIGQPSDISKIYHYGKSLTDIVSGKGVEESLLENVPEVAQAREAAFGQQGTKSQAEYWTGAGLQAALLGVPFVHGKIRTLRETAFGEKPITPEAPPKVPETPVTDTVAEQPIIPEDRFPSLLRSDENLRRGELQQQLNKERGFELVPEPPPEIAPAPTVEQTLETAQAPEPRVSPETGFTFPNEPETRTHLSSETAIVGGEPNAIQEQSTSSVLPHPQEAVAETGGERVGVGQGIQGEEITQARPETETVTEPVPQPEQPIIETGSGPVSTTIPDWAREEMQRRGLNPGRTFNDVDLGNPSVREAIKGDPTLSTKQKQQLLATGDTGTQPVKTKEAVIPPEVQVSTEVPAETPIGGVHAEALAERPIDEIPAGTEIGWQDARKLGNDFLDKGGSINKVMADFNRTGKLSVRDIGAGRAYLERLQAVTDRAQDALRNNPTDPVLQQNYGTARAAEQRFSEDYKPMATAASNQLKGFQGRVPLTEEMADSFTALSRKYGEIQGKQMTPEEVVKADRIAKQNSKVKTEYQAANDELYRKADTEYGRIRTNRKAAPTFEDLGKTFGQVLKEVCET